MKRIADSLRMSFGGILALGLAFAFTSNVQAQKDEIHAIPFEGFEVLKFLLHQKGLEPIASFEGLSKADPSQTVLMVLGRVDALEGGPNLAKFVARGGNFLYASDYRDPRLVNGIPWNLSVMGLKFQQPEGGYLDNPDCPYFVASTLPPHPLFRGMFKGLATNAPSYFETNRPNWPVSLRLPLGPPPKDVADAFARIFQGGARGPFYLFASGADAGPGGRCVFLAGHGVFVNGMLLQSEADNFMFANNVLRWLRESNEPSASRKICLVIDGEVVPTFDVSLKAEVNVPVPTPEVINRLLVGLEREDFFHRLLFENVSDTILWRLCAGLGTLALIGYGLKRLAASRFHQDTQVAQTVGPTFGMPILGNEIDQHLLALRIAPNLTLPARELARRWFQHHHAISAEWWRTQDGASPASIQLHGWWPNPKLRRHAQWLWAIAQGMPTVTRREFLALRKILAELSHAVAKRQIVFENLPQK